MFLIVFKWEARCRSSEVLAEFICRRANHSTADVSFHKWWSCPAESMIDTANCKM